jgi:ribosomal protein L11 methyltransferase
LADSPAIEIRFSAPLESDPHLRDRLYALLDDFGPLAIQEDDAGEWRVFFRTSADRDGAAAAARDALRGSGELTVLDVPDEDWARRSQQDLHAVRAGRLVIAPPWDVPRSSDVPVIVIEPSTGFGTGHHATTRLCLELLQTLDLRGARVVDIGTGSGVLALGAWKLGARDVIAVDNDPDALQNARENIARNGAGAAIDIICDDLAAVRLERADVVLANLTGAALVRCASELMELVRAGGYLIVSGFAPADAAIIGRAFAPLTRIAEREDGDWAAALAHRV